MICGDFRWFYPAEYAPAGSVHCSEHQTTITWGGSFKKMKTLMLRFVALGTVLSLPLVGGCRSDETPPAPHAATNVFTPPAHSNLTPPVALPAQPTRSDATATPAEPAVAEAVQPEVPFAVDRPIPAHLTASASLRELIKLAQAGVDEQILLTFINNSTSSFLLGADEIIYLTDIGVPGHVINSMMERDKTLRTAFVAAMPPPAASSTVTQVVAAAPAYVEAPAAESAPAAEPVVTDSQFEEALSPYGSWVYVEGYGRCWQPTVVVVNRNWRPYLDGGRWLYTDAGWYWYSDYSWGWAPFHYGRWFSHPRWGWCWSPGYTWGPAWVTWSYTDNYCGWAPLPPAAVYTGSGFTYYGSSVSFGFSFGLTYASYSYVPWGSFCDYRPWRYCVPPPRCKEIHPHARPHNDYGHDHNRRVVNRGLPPDRVASYTRSEVRRVNLREVAETRPTPGRREELARDGGSLEIRRPQPARSAVARPTDSVGERAGSPRSSAGSLASQPNVPTTPSGQWPSPPATSTPETRLAEGGVRAPISHSPATAVSEPGNQPAERPARAGANQPLVMVGNGDGQPPAPSTWTPYGPRPTTPLERESHRDVVSERIPAPEVGESELHQSAPTPPPATAWTQPARPSAPSQNRSQVIRVGRGIEDRTAGSPNYRIYSSPQAPAPSAPNYGPTAPVNSPGNRPTTPRATPRNVESDSGSSAYQPPRPAANPTPPAPAPRAVERPPTPRPAPAEARPAPAPSRPSSPPARSESRANPENSGTPTRSR
jgi:hypothetical protein